VIPLNHYLILSGILFSIGTAGIFLRRNLITMLLVVVYVGAVAVLFLFVVMMLNVPREEAPGPGAVLGPQGMKIAVVLSVVLAIEIVWALSRVGVGWFAQDPAALSVSSVTLIGTNLFTRHAFAFEATSILILVAMVGAVVLARRER
jgi:NADH-quinone oxidoreductase subunit J